MSLEQFAYLSIRMSSLFIIVIACGCVFESQIRIRIRVQLLPVIRP